MSSPPPAEVKAEVKTEPPLSPRPSSYDLYHQEAAYRFNSPTSNAGHANTSDKAIRNWKLEHKARQATKHNEQAALLAALYTPTDYERDTTEYRQIALAEMERDSWKRVGNQDERRERRWINNPAKRAGKKRKKEIVRNALLREGREATNKVIKEEMWKLERGSMKWESEEITKREAVGLQRVVPARYNPVGFVPQVGRFDGSPSSAPQSYHGDATLEIRVKSELIEEDMVMIKQEELEGGELETPPNEKDGVIKNEGPMESEEGLAIKEEEWGFQSNHLSEASGSC